ncbi:acetate uptake transporter family protein [Ascoidea rubescens DSM 1968]|uniref:Putative acetate transporter n=1 Tax=Ascoidea rubescens DSM 1968 TaxID=1344418 RepID=A0A1D2VNL2_9ASCO|nr:putative acetate transporter [Ascoidea rubescens DSM 1968]ODV63211.1 putative acetate transporter [Ascoidea rubescens DSM 1968]
MSAPENHFPLDLEKGYASGASSAPKPYSPNHIENNLANGNVTKVTSEGNIVYLGDQAFHKHELINAFGGDLNPKLHAPSVHRYANPVPLGLSSFSFCTLVLSLINCQARSVTNPNVLIGSFFFYGGAIELFAGLLCFVVENTFACCVLGAFGGFWLSYGAILSDSFAITSSYSTADELHNALGFFLFGWVLFAFLMWLCTFKSTWAFFLMFFFIWFFILILCIAEFTQSVGLTKAGGVLGVIAALFGFYHTYAGVAEKDNSYFVLRALPMPHAPKV